MGNYYYLMAGLPDLSLEDSNSGPSLLELKDDLKEILSYEDKKLIYYFFLQYDCKNLVGLLKDADAQIDPKGNYVMEQYKDMMISAREMNFNVHRYPSFMSEFARDYKYNKDSEGFFAEDVMAQRFYEYAVKCPNKMIASWFRMNYDITNVLTAMIARKNGWDVSSYVMGNGEVAELLRNNNTRDFGLSAEYDYVNELMKIVDCEDPVEKERKIDAFKWIWLDEKTFADVFSVEAVFAYLAKLEILERWAKLDVEQGREKFRMIIENLRNEAQVPDEFKKQ
ncbi:MAG: DUF2764 family protein [Paraprevotella sp.]|jgi:hypothetical protein|nr:DUF2764 family protein [Paraprevotella sp.]MBR0362038.1 DUF2764 family protein [Paraprevotella sp.]